MNKPNNLDLHLSHFLVNDSNIRMKGIFESIFVDKERSLVPSA